MERLPLLKASDDAHAPEHSMEVMVPFLQHLYGEAISILPIALADQRPGACLALGQALASVLTGKRAAVIASTDLSHYLPHQRAQGVDRHAIEAILSLEPEALAEAVEAHDITMCGPGGVMAMVASLKALGAREARLLGYATSGDTGGDYTAVVGYCAVQVGP
jgi:AmmeMemoRadiSam system protein B